MQRVLRLIWCLPAMALAAGFIGCGGSSKLPAAAERLPGKWRGEMIVNQHTEAQKRHAESRHIPPREASAKRERPHESGGSARHT